MKYLIVSADDFGLSESVNEGIIKGCKEGIVTSVHAMPAGPAFESALRMAKEAGLQDAGAHLTLTGTAPVSKSSTVHTLLSRDGKFHKNYAVLFANMFLGKINLGQIYTELKSQLDILRRSGLKILSLSSHEHVHMMPPFLDIFVRLAKEYNVPSIRYPYGEYLARPITVKKIYRMLILACLAGGMWKTLEQAGIFATDNSLGFLDSDNIREGTLVKMMETLKDGTTELFCHPGFLSPETLNCCGSNLHREDELAALTSRRVKDTIRDKDIKLIGYREFLSMQR